MCLEDLDIIYKLERKLFPNPWPKCFFERDLLSENTIALVAVRLPSSRAQAEGSSPKAEGNDTVVGYAIATYIDTTFHITNIGIDENYHRQGIATRFMVVLEQKANEIGCTFAYLEVRTNNSAAINFYKKLGYTIHHVHQLYYIDGDDAYVMQKELK